MNVNILFGKQYITVVCDHIRLVFDYNCNHQLFSISVFHDYVESKPTKFETENTRIAYLIA